MTDTDKAVEAIQTGNNLVLNFHKKPYISWDELTAFISEESNAALDTLVARIAELEGERDEAVKNGSRRKWAELRAENTRLRAALDDVRLGLPQWPSGSEGVEMSWHLEDTTAARHRINELEAENTRLRAALERIRARDWDRAPADIADEALADTKGVET